MKPLGLNRGGYLGDCIDPDRVMACIRDEAARDGWTVEALETEAGVTLPVLRRHARRPGHRPLRCYLSAGIHGDEPAGPLALLDLFRARLLPDHLDLTVCPVLNPRGLRANDRNNTDGIDLNRDYNHLRAPETRAHVAWLTAQGPFDVTVLLHEDWESAGFYLYELHPEEGPGLAHVVVDAVSRVCPIEHATQIDGREAHAPGIIRPSIDPRSRPDWPEAFWLLQHRTPRNLTLEAPSDFPLATRVAALVEAVRAVVGARLAPAAWRG
ncbi:MAG: M14 family metallocarboxypeptidase [Verrucomicrobiota bacterium]